MGGDVEKPMVDILGVPMVRYVLDALAPSRSVAKIYCATSSYTPETERYLEEADCNIIRCPGDGYVKDLQFAIMELGLEVVMVVSADLPLIGPGDVDWVMAEYGKRGKPHMAVYVPWDLGEVPAGVNVVHGGFLDEPEDEIIMTDKVQFALNVNTHEDLAKAKSYLGGPTRKTQ
jgi:adenosylcobinamide-phosphate guanylyltransferase